MNTKVDRFLVLITALFFLLASFIVVSFTEEEKQVFNIKGYPTLGAPRAPVQLVIFEDLKCIWCSRFSADVLPKIKKKYIDTEKANYTVILLAFLSKSKPAANAALEVYHQDPALFFPFIEAIYGNQPPEEQNWATEETLQAFAVKIPGINVKKMIQSMKRGTYNEQLENNFDFAQEIMQDKFGTPTLYINGVALDDLSYEKVSSRIEEALKND